jgi:hypothetical protein
VEEIDEIAFARTVGPDEDVKGAQLEVLQLADGLEPFNREPFDGVAHKSPDVVADWRTVKSPI